MASTLGHPSLQVVPRIPKDNKITAATNNSSPVCDACQQAKTHQLPFASSSHMSSALFELIHTDVWGPALLSVNNSKCYVSFIDDYSRFVWIYFLKNKSDVEVIFHQFQRHVERVLGSKI